MIHNEAYFTDLISRYLYGESTADEIREMETWVRSDPDHAAFFTEYLKTWKTLADDRVESSTNLDLEWKSLHARILHPASGIRHPASRILHPALRIAAALLLLLIPAWLLVRYLARPAEKQLTALTGMVEQHLPDGTAVTLDAGATLSYPTRFTGLFRDVKLSGRAWFEVSHDPSHPFVVAAGNTRIRVVGTTFSVNALPGRETQEVVLATGRVTVYYGKDTGHTAYLVPGDCAEVSTGRPEIRVSRNRNVNFLAWKTKQIIFSDTPLAEAVALISQVYRTPVTLTGTGPQSCRITATFEGQTLESVLNVLAATLDLKYSKTGTGYELSGIGCHPGE